MSMVEASVAEKATTPSGVTEAAVEALRTLNNLTLAAPLLGMLWWEDVGNIYECSASFAPLWSDRVQPNEQDGGVSYFDDNDDSPAVALWSERLDSYMDGQEGVEALRRRIQPNPPWPEADNPMLGYLIARAMEIYEEQGPEPAITWVAVHAWFESALDVKADLIRRLGA